MLCKEIIQVIEASYPKEAALDFDNVGLLAGRLEKEGFYHGPAPVDVREAKMMVRGILDVKIP